MTSRPIYPATRAAAKAAGVAFYFTGQPCKHGHIALRKTKGACVECLQVEWKGAATKRAAYFREYNLRPEVKEMRHEWYLDHRDVTIARASSRLPEAIRVYRDAWKARNPVSVLADNKARRRKHREATPEWLTPEQRGAIRAIYKSAIQLSRTTGVRYVVDHIYPLRGATVCGLHVPWNLRLLPHAENLEKSNKLPGPEDALAFLKI